MLNIKTLFKRKENPILLLSLFALSIAAIFSSGFHHPDEHFQVLEFAGLKLGWTTTAQLPWEYNLQIRQTLLPAIAVGMCRFLNLFGIRSPFFLATSLRFLSAGLSFLSMSLIYKLYKREIKNPLLSQWFLLLSFSLWFLIYLKVRFSGENWSGSFFTIGFCAYLQRRDKKTWFFLALGSLFGLSFLFRYPIAFSLIGLFAWMLLIKKEAFSNLVYLGSGFFLVFLLGILIDRWFYGNWTLSTWNYFEQNILEGKLSSFGVSPWWSYLAKIFIWGVPPFSILILAGSIALAVYKWKRPITWSIVPFFIIHSLLGHKELRFLFPMVNFVPILMVEATAVLRSKLSRDLLSSPRWKHYAQYFFTINFTLLLLICFKPADRQTALYEFLYKHYTEPTTLCYFQDKNPYRRARLNLYFYKRKNLSLKRIDSIQQLKHPRGQNVLIAFDKSVPPEIAEKYKLVYHILPGWITNFKFFKKFIKINHIWYIYQLKISTPDK